MPYLTNSMSRYVGSGHRSSGITFSNRSATSRTAFIAGITLSRMWITLEDISSPPSSPFCVSSSSSASLNSSIRPETRMMLASRPFVEPPAFFVPFRVDVSCFR